MKHEIQHALRQLPSVDEAVRELAGSLGDTWPRWAVVQAVRDQLEALREALLAGAEPARARLDPEEVTRRVRVLLLPSLRPVFNATGVVVHTNLGRAPLGRAVLQRVVEIAAGYSNLEYDIDSRRRGSRHVHAAGILGELTGAEDAAVVNNNAAAVLLCLAALARGREVVVSRGELIEIGGSFRLPDVMAASGAILREVGTTNRTHLLDYERALGEQTALLLKVHRSNFALQGFVAEVAPEELVALGRRAGLPALFDLGSGSLLATAELGLPGEPTVQQAVRAGFDLVTFSGDKMLGGPQAGLIVGSAAAVARVRGHPLMRALRPDKVTLAALQATLEAYRDGRALCDLPVPAMLHATPQALGRRARRLRGLLRRQVPPPWSFALLQVSGRVGGGALPLAELPSVAVTVTHPQRGPDAIEALLRSARPPVIARIEQDRLLLDVRTIADDQVSPLARAAAAALGDQGLAAR